MGIRAAWRAGTMKSPDRMFRVLVLGGIALTACGGATATGSASDAGGDADAFPPEGPDASYQDVFPSEGPPVLLDSGIDSFPSEGPALLDSGIDEGIDSGVDSFPTEGPPPPIDSGGPPETGVDSSPPCFPQETAIQWDGCAPIIQDSGKSE